MPPRNVAAAIAAGVGFVPADRHVSGFAPDLSIAENLTASVMGRLGHGGWVGRQRRNHVASRLVAELDIVPPDLDVAVGGLSGGNQQKVVMGRALANRPKILVAITPTAGVDIASKAFLYDQLRRAARDGAGVLLITDEIDEIAVADRIVVMFEKAVVAEFDRPWTNNDVIAAIEGVHNPAHLEQTSPRGDE